VLPIVNKPNERWSMDFVQVRFADGRVFRCFNLVDDFTHECLLILTAKSIRSKNLVEALNLLKISPGWGVGYLKKSFATMGLSL